MPKPLPYPVELIAIDLDGTLVDSVLDLHAAVIQMQVNLGYPPASVQSVREWVGNGIERLVHRALTRSMHDDASPEFFAQALEQFRVAYSHTNGKASCLYPGVRQALEWLATLDIPLVCITNKAGCYSRPLLDTLGISQYFVHHIAGDDVSAKKPDPAGLLEAMNRCDATAENSIMIGDSLSDINAARAAGFTMIAVSYGYNHGVPIDSLREQQSPDLIIDSMIELKNSLPTRLISKPQQN